MGYLDGVIASSFKERDDGSVVFYPWGIFGKKGYELRDEAHHREMRAFTKRFLVASFGVILLLVLIRPVASRFGVDVPIWFNPALAAVLITALYFLWRHRLRPLLGDAPVVHERQTLSDTIPATARRFGLPTLIVLELLVLIGFWFAATMWQYARVVDHSYMQTFTAVFMVMLGLSAVVYGWMIGRLLGHRRSDQNASRR